MKFLVADDHELFLKGLELILIGKFPKAQIILAHNYNEIFNRISEQNDFDVILTDLAMPGDVWNNAIQKIHEKVPETPIIILSAIFDKEIVQKTIEIGVSGYLSKTSSHMEILEALDLVLSGGVYLPTDFLHTQRLENDKLLKGLLEATTTTNITTDKHLTPRQKAVLECASQGKANKQIAYELGLTEGTVKLHITAILKILGVYNRTAAVVEAVKLGLISNPNEHK